MYATVLYDISNCDTVKKSRAWRDAGWNTRPFVAYLRVDGFQYCAGRALGMDARDRDHRAKNIYAKCAF